MTLRAAFDRLLRTSLQDRKPPSIHAVVRAEKLAACLRERLCNDGIAWFKPHVSASARGEVTLEWWKRDRKLSIFSTGPSLEYLKVWGADINHEMEDGDLSSEDDPQLLTLWKWLLASADSDGADKP